MDIKRMKYNQELIKNKIRLEKQLKMVNKELAIQQDECNHIRVVLDCDGSYKYQRIDNSIMYCLNCAADLSYVRQPSPIIDATFYNRGLNYLERLQNVRNVIIKIKESNPEISDKDLLERAQAQIDNDSKFITDDYSKQMILCRNSNNRNL